jgi:hypothetical protein
VRQARRQRAHRSRRRAVHLPGIFVHRIVHVPEHENAFEYRTVRKRP